MVDKSLHGVCPNGHGDYYGSECPACADGLSLLKPSSEEVTLAWKREWRMPRFIFSLSFGPEETLEIATTSVFLAIEAGTVALPHCAIAAREQEAVQETSQGIWYTLTCLLCDLSSPQHDKSSDLVTMQQHLSHEHQVPYEEQSWAASVCDKSASGATCYVSWLPAHGALYRASRFASQRAENRLPCFSLAHFPAIARQEHDLILYHRADPSIRIPIHLQGIDTSAWYGMLSHDLNERLLIFPNNCWSSVSC